MKNYYVYKVTNEVNGKIYIGRSIDFFRRITQHCKKSESESSQLHIDIKEYGISNFNWKILNIVEGREKADELERLYIKKFNCIEPNGYNKTLGGTNGVPWETKPIICFEEDGTILKKYDSASQTVEDGFFLNGVIDCCEGKATRCHGKVFMYEEDYIKDGFKKRKKDYSLFYHPVVQCDLQGNFLAEYESVQSAAETTGIKRASISANITGARKTSGNYIFVYKEDFPITDFSKHTRKKKGRKVASVNPDTNEIVEVFNSIAEAGRKLGVNYKAIQRIVDRDNRTAYGFKWISQ